MQDPLIIIIGNAGKGGWWYKLTGAGAPTLWLDGFETEAAAIADATTAAGSRAWEIWYTCAADGRLVTMPGARSDNHPEVSE